MLYSHKKIGISEINVPYLFKLTCDKSSQAHS
uniref:Uncharacterized protein n=1 Tax=Arundo donax TaxID=35708 RepID=A0A0A8YXL8_ARUDO